MEESKVKNKSRRSQPMTAVEEDSQKEVISTPTTSAITADISSSTRATTTFIFLVQKVLLFSLFQLSHKPKKCCDESSMNLANYVLRVLHKM